MTFDGFTMRCLAVELSDKLQGSRIEKIYQPQSDTLVVYIHTNRGRQKLLISSNPSSPRLYLTGNATSSQRHPPMFCMLLRKHLGGGTLLSIDQYGMDRVLEFKIKTTDELGLKGTKSLVCEIMGRHSNIILLNSDGKIIDAIKRVTPDMSTYRQVLPGIVYKRPPSQAKLDFTQQQSRVLEREFSQHIGVKSSKAVLNTLEGFGTDLATEFCLRSGIDPDSNLDRSAVQKLHSTIEEFRDIIKHKVFSPVIYYREDMPVGFSPVALSSMELPGKTQPDISTMLDNYYHQRLLLEVIRQQKDRLYRIASAQADKNQKKLGKRLRELKCAEDKSHYGLYGELITANLYRLKEKVSRTVLEDYTKPGMPKVSIELDPELTPLQNAQRFFREYNHGKRTRESLQRLISKTKQELDYLEGIIYSIDKCTGWSELQEIKMELEKGGYIKPARVRDKRKSHAPSKPLIFLSKDNMEILVGRNNHQNDYLTLRCAKKDDVWLHTKDIPGSHVLVRCEGKELSEVALYQAALLAAYYSKARQSSSVPVDYTRAKYVSKPKGAKPGYVIYKNQRTIFVTPSQREVTSLRRPDLEGVKE